MKIPVFIISVLYGIASAGKLGHGHDDTTNTISGSRGTAKLMKKTFNAVAFIEGQVYVFPYGEEIFLQAPFFAIGERRDVKVVSGFVTTETGITFQLNEGTLKLVRLPTEVQAISIALAKSGITLEQFIQQTGDILPQHRFDELLPSILSFDGIERNVISGVVRVLSLEILQVINPTNEGVQPAASPAIGETGVQPVVGETITKTVTETAVHETETITEPVTLTKTQTQDEFVTITSPVYNSIAATIVSIVKQTVTVPEEQVIRSPVASSVIVNINPVATQTVLTVSVRSTNIFVRTVTDEVTNEHTHFVTNYSISTATVKNPVTSTVVQTITQTSVSTVYNTSTVGKTVYATTTLTVNIGTAGAY